VRKGHRSVPPLYRALPSHFDLSPFSYSYCSANRGCGSGFYDKHLGQDDKNYAAQFNVALADDRAFNFSALNNVAAKEARGKFLVLLNNDVEVIPPDWLSEMVSIASQPGVGAVGARLWYPNETLQHGGVILGIGGVPGTRTSTFHGKIQAIGAERVSLRVLRR
jgi:hypothetical protein